MPVCKGKITPSIFGATGAVIKIWAFELAGFCGKSDQCHNLGFYFSFNYFMVAIHLTINYST